jgi:hypothetical protein
LSNILVPVDKHKIQKTKDTMRKFLELATNTGKGTYREITSAQMMLERAKGMYDALSGMGLLDTIEQTNALDDIVRIGEKIDMVYREKEAEALARHMQRK